MSGNWVLVEKKIDLHKVTKGQKMTLNNLINKNVVKSKDVENKSCSKSKIKGGVFNKFLTSEAVRGHKPPFWPQASSVTESRRRRVPKAN